MYWRRPWIAVVGIFEVVEIEIDRAVW